MSAKSLPPGENKTVHIGGFIFLGVFGCALIVVTGFRTLESQRRAAKDATQLQTKVDDADSKLQQSLLSQKSIEGQLLAFGIVLGQMRDMGGSGSRELANAVQQLAKANAANAQVIDMNNKQLCARAGDVAKRMREIELRYRAQEQAAMDRQRNTIRTLTNQDDQTKAFSEMTQGMTQFYFQKNQEYTSTVLAEALFVRDELLRRIRTPPPSPQNEGTTAFTGSLAGPAPLTMGAAYLEELSKTLCQ